MKSTEELYKIADEMREARLEEMPPDEGARWFLGRCGDLTGTDLDRLRSLHAAIAEKAEMQYELLLELDNGRPKPEFFDWVQRTHSLMPKPDPQDYEGLTPARNTQERDRRERKAQLKKLARLYGPWKANRPNN